MPGPAPNRTEDLSRARDANRGNRPDVSKAEMFPVEIPETPEHWHEIAKMVFDSLKTSGQSVFFQNSDWAFAYLVCNELHVYCNTEKPKAFHLQQIFAAMGSLLLTEADRRKVRIELQKPEPVTEPTHISVVRSAKEALDAD